LIAWTGDAGERAPVAPGASSGSPGRIARAAAWQTRRTMKRILCLCHDVTDADVARAVRLGFDHPETVKRFTGALMGPCQGRSCAELVLEAIARATGVDPAGLRVPTARPPAFAVPMGILAAGGPRDEPVDGPVAPPDSQAGGG
jgi:bacterioferritin-associated ferredoxin